LTFFYAPSASTAWESTHSMYMHPFQHFMLSVHYWGASAMIALLFLHLLQVVVWGAYKSPREIQWIVGVLLLLSTMVLGLTGYLLPWDMDAYFASQVAINLTLTMPVIGVFIQQFAQDGTTMGTLTINRFFGLHVWLMPALLVALVGAHLAIFRWNGPAGPPLDEAPKVRPGRFWPDQLFMDTVLSFVLFAIVVALSILSPVPLDDKADPNNSTFVPYPAWYFLALYALLDVVGTFPPALVQAATLFATIIGPTLLIVVLIALPFIDRNPSRRLTRRPWVLGITALVMAGAIAFSWIGQNNVVTQQLAHNIIGPGAQSAVAAAPAAVGETGPNGTASNAQGTSATSTGGSGGTAGAPASTAAGASVYTTNCSGCHGAQGAGAPGAFPPLAANPMVTGDAKPVIKILLNGLTGKVEVKGQTYNGQMPPWKAALTNKQIADVITYIRNAWGNKASTVTEADVTAASK
ncbi:MAG: cytochrome b N-terminal domain-containing protein, partial [Candidatus Eremiobacteraeota bacterium]|nr:cytochrome b N-terminal domain-containing protein [Candidatus Eremiobacteraeota bacterium]